MISHLMFANGCILFEEVVEREVVVIMEGLKEHEACSRQCINFEKSLLFFSSNCLGANPSYT